MTFVYVIHAVTLYVTFWCFSLTEIITLLSDAMIVMILRGTGEGESHVPTVTKLGSFPSRRHVNAFYYEGF